MQPERETESVGALSLIVSLSDSTAIQPQRLSGNSALRSESVLVFMLDLHLVQHRPSKPWSNSGQSSGGHITPRQRIGSALLLGPMPPPMPLAQDLSSGTLISLQQSGQQVPISSGVLVANGGTHSRGAHVTPLHVSWVPP